MRFFNVCRMAACCLLCSMLVLGVSLMKNPYGRLAADGERVGTEYYLYSPSSQAKICSGLTLAEWFHLTGEKSVFVFKSGEAATSSVEKFLQEMRAKVVWVEEVSGGKSIYAHSLGLGERLDLFSQKVNLHIVVHGNTVQVGTPIIFGGY